MTCKVNADTTNALKLTSDTSGEIDLQTNGTTKVHMDSSGNVGIGTSSPSALLNVKKGTNVDSTGQPSGNFAATVYHATNSSTSHGLLVKNNWAATASTVFEVGLDIVGGAYRQYYKIDGQGQAIWSPLGTEAMRINTNGVVTKPYQPAFVATNNAGTHTTNAGSTFDFNVEKFDKGNNYDPSTYRFTAPVSGTYYFNFHIYLFASASQKSIAYKVNGSYFSIQDTAISYQGTVDISSFTIDGPIMLDLAANDYVEVAVRNVASANTSWYGGHSWFMGYLIG